jgi:3-hydroxyisobutyrate dehydrogenase-like beta-hydroxyacid dehydrogenase
MSTLRAGFIGLGKMGRPMALNMLKAGFPLTVANRSQGVVADVASHGATAAKTSAEVAANADLIALFLPMPAHVEEVVLGPNGVIEGIRPGSIVIDFSTIGPSTCRHVAERLAEKGAIIWTHLFPEARLAPLPAP